MPFASEASRDLWRTAWMRHLEVVLEDASLAI